MKISTRQINFARKQLKVKNNQVTSFQLVILHAAIGLSVAIVRPLGWLYFLGIFGFFLYQLIKPNVKPVHILMACAYMVGGEIFLRMSGAFLLNEIGKYSVMLFCMIGMYKHGIKGASSVYFIFILLLLPSIYFTYENLPYDADFRKTILFNLSGPLSLGTAAIYCMNRKVSFEDILKILNAMVYPIIAISFYIFLRAPSTAEAVTSTDSNFAASGGFGPNQVATILGLGMFVLFVRLLIPYKDKLLKLVMFGILAMFAFRALVTMSRGGVFTAIIMMMIFSILFLLYAPVKMKVKGIGKLGFLVGGAFVLWMVTAVMTSGMLINRYENKDATGKEKDATTGRGDIISEDLALFLENPVYGIGPGMGKFIRYERTGNLAAAHNEFSRMFAEHGSFGIAGLLILILVPGFKFLLKPSSLFIVPFALFWLLTVNHSAMRVAAPGMVYALCLLDVQYATRKKESKATLLRKQASTEEPQLNPS